MPRSPRPRRRALLSLQGLEARATPAAAAYSALTQTLTVTAAQADRLVVSALPNKPMGYLTVTEAQASATVFDSNASKWAVRNLVVRFDNVATGDLTLDGTVQLGGRLTVAAATGTQTVTLAGSVGGNVTYLTPTVPGTAAIDEINLESSAVVGGNVRLVLGTGQNTVRLKGGTVHGSLAVLGGAGQDQVELTADADLTVNGSMTLALGGGSNTVVGRGTYVTRVSNGFSYFGGAGDDTIDLDSIGATLSAGGNARFVLGTPTGFDVNTVKLEALYGRDISFVGGAGADSVEVSGAFEATGNATFLLGDGDNLFDSNTLGVGTNLVAGNFTYLGGVNGDAVSLDNTTVGRNVAVTLGEAIGGSSYFGTGLRGPGRVAVFGNVMVADGAGGAGIFLTRLTVGGGLTVLAGGGNDQVSIDDTNVAGTSLFALGGGNDNLVVEFSAGNGGGPLNGVSTFGGPFRVFGGGGDDQVILAETNDRGRAVVFGGRVALVGGSGNDTLHLQSGATFEHTGNSDDFETRTGPLLP